jgi:hypothetical protein
VGAIAVTVFAGLRSHCHDSGESKNQWFERHFRFHGVSPCVSLVKCRYVLIHCAGSVTHPGTLVHLDHPSAAGEGLVAGGDLATAGWVSVALEFVGPLTTPANSPALSTMLAVVWLIWVEGLALTVDSPQDIDSFFTGAGPNQRCEGKSRCCAGFGNSSGFKGLASFGDRHGETCFIAETGSRPATGRRCRRALDPGVRGAVYQ